MFKACEQFFRLPDWTTQETVVASRSGCEHEYQEFIVDSGASLHMMSKNELTFGGEKMPSADRKNPPSSRPPTEKAESTEDATVYVNDLDVFVTLMLLEDSQQCYL